MSSIKCPHCGLVNFSSGGTCKRCKNVLSASAVTSSVGPSTAVPRQSSIKRENNYPLVAWAVTLLLLIANASLSYVVSRKSNADFYETLGGTVGGMIAWPLVLLIIYALSKKFREKYSLHAVINYGLGLNTIILAMMTLR